MISKINKRDQAILQLIEVILMRGWSSRIKQQLRAKQGLVYKIESKVEFFINSGYFIIVFTTSKKGAENAVELIHQEFQKLSNTIVDEEELIKAKGYYTGQLAIHSDEPLFLNFWYGKQAILNPDNIQTFEDRWDLINTISSLHIEEVAQQFFTESNWLSVI